MTRNERLSLYSRAAKFAFGSRWQSEAARYHGVAVRTMQRWVALEQDIPDGLFDEMARLLYQRWAEIEMLMYELEATKRTSLPKPIKVSALTDEDPKETTSTEDEP